MTLGSYAHQDLPFERLVEELRPERSLDRAPLFQVMLTLQNAPLPGWTMGDVRISPLPVEAGTAKFDLELMSDEREEALPLAAEYSTDLFDAATIDRLLSHFATLAAAIAAEPERRLSSFPCCGKPNGGRSWWSGTTRRRRCRRPWRTSWSGGRRPGSPAGWRSSKPGGG